MPALVALMLSLSIATQPSFLTLPPREWKLSWSDEFDGLQLDTGKWAVGLPWTGDDGTNWHHNSQYASVITDEDVKVRNGFLYLTCQRKQVPNPRGGFYSYTEGLITTAKTFRQKFGYFEMRAKLPVEAGPGTWPAFWMLAEGWPPEMDIMEYWGSHNRTHQGTVVNAGGKQRWDSFHRTHTSIKGWHNWGLEWGPGYQIYYLDGKPTGAIYGDHIPEVPFYLLLNSGIESARPPVPETVFPNAFVVDYCRVYARPDGPSLINAEFENEDVAPWSLSGNATVVDYSALTGKRSLRLDGKGSEAKQTVYGLKGSSVASVTVRTQSETTIRLTYGSAEVVKTVMGKAVIEVTLEKSDKNKASLAVRLEGPGIAFVDDVKVRASR